MKCSCPKCSAPLTENLSAIPEKGRSGKCPECGGSYWIHRESFILRCYTVAGERYCSHCGETLGQSTYCPGCGSLYPDYCIVHSKKPPQRPFEKKEFSLGFSLPVFTGKSAAPVFIQGKRSASRGGGSSDLRRQLLIVGAGIAFLAVMAAVFFLYKQNRAEEKFIKEYVVALYGLKSGTDQCMKKVETLASGSRLADKDLAQLRSVQAEIATALQVLSPPPKKFNAAHTDLEKLAGTYEKLYNLCLTSAPAAEIASSAGALESQFNTQAKALKSSLSPPLLAELTAMTSRYRNLQFMLE